MSAGIRTLHGRIPGRPGTWEVTVDDMLITAMTCRDASAAGVTGSSITPGLFDLQINGITGINFTDASVTPDQLQHADSAIRAWGISRYCPTIITSSFETALAVLKVFAGEWGAGRLPAAWAIHLEGPWISDQDGARGIHHRELVRDVSLSEWDALQAAAGGRIRVLTLAQERHGSSRSHQEGVPGRHRRVPGAHGRVSAGDRHGRGRRCHHEHTPVQRVPASP